MKYKYTGDTIAEFNAFPLWLIKGHEYERLVCDEMNEQPPYGYFIDEGGNTRRVPLRLMEFSRYTADDLSNDPDLRYKQDIEFLNKHLPVDELPCMEVVSM